MYNEEISTKNLIEEIQNKEINLVEKYKLNKILTSSNSNNQRKK